MLKGPFYVIRGRTATPGMQKQKCVSSNGENITVVRHIRRQVPDTLYW